MTTSSPTSEYLREELREINSTTTAILRDAAMTGGELSTRNARRVAELQDKALQLHDRIEQKQAEESRAARAAAMRLPDPSGGRPSDSPFSRGEVGFLSTLWAAKQGDSRSTQMIAAHDELRAAQLSASGHRAVVTSGAGAFVPSIAAGIDYQPFNYNSTAPLWSHLGPEPIPADYGMSIDLPRFTSGASVAGQVAQGSAIADSSPTVTDVQIPIVTMAGGITLSRQLLERSTPMAEGVILDELRRSYAASVEAALCSGTATGTLTGIATLGTADGVLTQSVGTADTGTGSAFIGKLAEGLVDLADSVYSTDAVFVMSQRRWQWVASRSDGDGRPFINPVAGRSGNADNGSAYGRNVGTILGIPVITTAGIRNDYSTNQDRILLMANGAYRCWQAAPEPQRLLLDVAAGEGLMVRASIVNYIAAAAVNPSGIVVFSGAGLTDPFA